MLLLAPLPGVALKTYLEYRINKKIKWTEAIISGVVAVLLGWFVGYLTFAFFFDPKDMDSIPRALNFTIITSVTTGLLGEKVGLYVYENFPSIMDAFVSKFTGSKPSRTRRPRK